MESGLVGFEGLLTSIFTSVVDIDSDCFGELNSKSNGFNFGKSESFTESFSVIISDGLTSDGGSKSF